MGYYELRPRQGRLRWQKLLHAVKSHRVVTGLGCTAAVAAMFAAVLFPAAVTASTTERQLPIYNVQRDQKILSISFDAAWGAEDTDTLIEILDRYQVKATFFVVGDWVDRYPEEVKKLSEAGHEVMNHSNTHPYLTQCDQQTIIDEITACNEKVAAITGVTPTLIRCPYGDYNNQVIETIRSLGMEPIQWNVDSLDWKELSAPEITDRVLSQVDSGSIVLFHNAALHTPEALPGILESLISDGYTLVPISELILKGDYTIDVAGCQHPA